MTREDMAKYDKQMLDVFINTCISTGKVIKTDGFENLRQKTILKIEDILDNNSDNKARYLITELLS